VYDHLILTGWMRSRQESQHSAPKEKAHLQSFSRMSMAGTNRPIKKRFMLYNLSRSVLVANDIMITLKTIGRVFFAIPIVVFGVQYLTYGRFVRGLPPVPPWAPGGAAAAYLTGALLVAAGVCILANVQVRLSAAVLGTFCFVCAVALHTMRLTRVIHEGDERTGAFEALALAASAWVLAGSSPAGVRVFEGWQTFTDVLGRLGFICSRFPC
jgi:uncharacterized membrane protein YphA (DoxX/SURF4 family)